MRDQLAGLMREVSTAVLETPGELDRNLRRRIAAGAPAPDRPSSPTGRA